MVELLVAMGLLALVSLTMFSLVSASSAAFRHGAARTDLQQRTRETMRRLRALVSQATSPGYNQEAILAPALGTSGPSLQFYCPDDPVGGLAVFDPRNRAYGLFEVGLETPGTRLLLKDVANPASTRLLGRDVARLVIEHPSLNLVQLTLEAEVSVRGASGRPVLQKCSYSTLIPLPYYTVK